MERWTAQVRTKIPYPWKKEVSDSRDPEWAISWHESDDEMSLSCLAVTGRQFLSAAIHL